MPRIDVNKPYLNRYPYKQPYRMPFGDYGAPPYLDIPVERSGCIYQADGDQQGDLKKYVFFTGEAQVIQDTQSDTLTIKHRDGTSKTFPHTHLKLPTWEDPVVEIDGPNGHCRLSPQEMIFESPQNNCRLSWSGADYNEFSHDCSLPLEMGSHGTFLAFHGAEAKPRMTIEPYLTGYDIAFPWVHLKYRTGTIGDFG